jgi:transmembrane protein
MNRFQVATITLLCLPLLASAQSASTDFITLWDTRNPQSSVVVNGAPAPSRDANTIYFPGIGENYTVRYRAENEAAWHDLNGVSSTPAPPLRVELPAPGKYYIAVAPVGFHGFRMGTWGDKFSYHGDADRLIGVVSWGAVQWEHLDFAFANSSHLAQLPLKHDAEFPDAIKAPRLATTSLGWMFYGCAALTERGEEGKSWDLEGWDVARVTSLAGAFKGCERFVGRGLHSWDVHSIQSFLGAFDGCTDFQRDLTAAEDISCWKTTSATNMAGMFMGCANLKADLSGWDVANVTDLTLTFSGCGEFNADLSQWKVGRVTSFAGTFARCQEFCADLSGWDVSNAVDLAGMFFGCENFNCNLGLWNVERVSRMDRLFYGCKAFNYPLGNWKPKSLLNAEGMLDGCTGMFPIFYDHLLHEWAGMENIQPNVTLTARGVKRTPRGTTGLEDLEDKEDFTLFAKFERAHYVITIVPDNGQNEYTETVAYGERLRRPTPDPVKKGYSFLGWQKDGVVYDFNSTVTGPFTLKARYRDERIAALNSCLLQGVEVMPNPVNAELHLVHAQSLRRYTLFNALGLPVLKGEHDGGETITLQVSALPAGVYFIRLEAADGRRTLRVVKQ